MFKKLTLTLALCLALTLAFVAAKPDPGKIPEIVDCHTPAQFIAAKAAHEPMCLHGDFQIFVLLYFETYEDTDGWYWIMDVLNSSFEATENCDGDGYFGRVWSEIHAYEFHRGADDQEYLPENCEPATLFLSLTWEERDPDTGNVDGRDTVIRKWTIPED